MDWSTLALTLLLAIVTIYYLFFRKSDKLEKLGILHLKSSSLFGTIMFLLFRPRAIAEAINDIYKFNDQAKYVGFYDFSEPVIMIRSPELIKDMAIKNFDHFVDHRGIVDASRDVLFGSNLFFLRGEKWRHMRTLLSPAFTSSKMKAMFKLMSICGKDFANYFAERSSNEPNTINAKDAFTRYTNDVIGTCAFGISVDSLRNPKNDFYVLGREATNFEGITLLKFVLLRNFPRISKFFGVKLINERIERFFEGVVRDTIEMRDREGITRPDMIQLMMESRGNRSGDAPELTILDMTAQAFIFFFGGFDTSSSLMCFVAYQIAFYADIQKKLQHEIDAIMEETNGEVTYEALNGMQYLDAIINETLRIYPILIVFDRTCVKPYELPPALPGAKPVIIQPGQNVWFPVFSIQRDPKYFRDPEKFDPERFIRAGKNDIDPFTYMPFGQGPRMCIGNRFALLETKVVIFYLLARCNLKPSSKMCMPLELSKASFTMSAKGGFWLELESRNNADVNE